MSEYTVTAGIMRWKSNGSVPPAEYVVKAAATDPAIDVAASAATRDTELRAFLAEYRKNYKGPTAEERAEARAAHGPGHKLTNIITGHKWRRDNGLHSSTRRQVSIHHARV